MKDSLIEWIKRIWAPIGGVIGVILLVNDFYKKWQSDSETINWVVVILATLFWFICLAWIICSSEKKRNGLSYSYGKRFREPYRNLAKLLFVISVISSFTFAFAYINRINEIRRIRQDKIVVLIAAFDGPEDVFRVQNKIIERLRSETSGLEEVLIVSIKEVITPVDGSEYAQDLGTQNDADLVIWGWYAPTENTSFTVHVEMLAPKDYSEYVLDESEIFEPFVLLNSLNSFSWQQELGTDTSALVVFLSGLLYQREGNYSESAIRFTKALELSSKSDAIVNDSDIFLYRGGAYTMSGRPEEAISDFSSIISNDPQYELMWLVFNERGATYADIGNFDLAMSDYNESVKLNPNEAIVFINRGSAFLGVGKPDLVLSDFDRGIQIGLDSTDREFHWMGATAYNNRGVAHNALGDIDNAIRDYSEALSYNPNYFSALLNRGIAYDDLGKYDLAINDYNRAIEIRPDDPSSYINRGVSFVNKKEYEKAVKDYTRAIELDPECFICYKNRAIAYNLLGEVEKFLSDAEKYCELIENASSLCN